MTEIFIISAIICIAGTVAILYLYEKLRRFSSAVIDELNSHTQLIDSILDKPENKDLKDQLLQTLNTLKRYRPYTMSELNDLYILDRKNAHLTNEPNQEKVSQKG
jgi:cell shape-determining protein MreC